MSEYWFLCWIKLLYEDISCVIFIHLCHQFSTDDWNDWPTFGCGRVGLAVDLVLQRCSLCYISLLYLSLPCTGVLSLSQPCTVWDNQSSSLWSFPSFYASATAGFNEISLIFVRQLPVALQWEKQLTMGSQGNLFIWKSYSIYNATNTIEVGSHFSSCTAGIRKHLCMKRIRSIFICICLQFAIYPIGSQGWVAEFNLLYWIVSLESSYFSKISCSVKWRPLHPRQWQLRPRLSIY